ncbi:hypothetical protein CHS0354_037638 [Potamilus streckersoni]|uniref:Calcium channel flower n=1 Tax=Potamilus streckersoni TaxID=2493646 RepID=A0AAE0T885_9BIVA|nr:hypothetical protein CHS0354_037638 [Potamilus streckersoni]
MQGSTQNNPDSGDQVTWWFKLLTRSVGVIGGIVAMITGVLRCITFTPLCLVAGLIEVLAGFTVVVFEAPCCCPFLDFIDKIGKFSEERPHWQKAVIYAVMAVFPVALCFSMTTIFGSALVFATGALYGMMALGKKADREVMLKRARSEDVELNATLITNEERVDLQVPESHVK